MKKILLYLIGLSLATALLVSCDPPYTTTVQTPEPTDNPSPVSAKPEPSPSILETPDPIVPADVSPTPEPPAPTLLTFDEAREICGTWLENHADLPSYTIHEWGYAPDEIPPPTYFLFGVPYYEFLVSYRWDGASGFSHEILVQAETGELLSLYRMGSDEMNLTTTVEFLDEWYAGEPAAVAPARLTTDGAIAIYDAWLYEHSDNPEYCAEYSIDKQSSDMYVLFGEQYYLFYAKDEWKYWYKILVHMKTGELLFMMITDGMFPETSIEPLDDWYDSTYAQ